MRHTRLNLRPQVVDTAIARQADVTTVLGSIHQVLRIVFPQTYPNEIGEKPLVDNVGDKGRRHEAARGSTVTVEA